MHRSFSDWKRMQSTRFTLTDVNAGTMTTQLGGKLVLSVEIGAVDEVPVKVVKL